MESKGLDLFEEKSLWSIYKQCISKLTSSKFNKFSTIALILVLLVNCIFYPADYVRRIELIRSLCDIWLGFGSTVLGFLIAGFTIFATLTKPELYVRMYETLDEITGLNHLKVNFFAFVEVFVVYLTVLVLCLFVKLFGSAGGFISEIILSIHKSEMFSNDVSKIAVTDIGFVVMGTLTFYSILVLKSFIYNIYHAVMTSIVWMLNEPKND